MADSTPKPPGPPTEEPLGQKSAPRPSERLESWKEIAVYLKREVRTVQRWEKHEGLPVHRHRHDERASVFAYKTEVDAWWHSDSSRLEDVNETGHRPEPEPLAARAGVAPGDGEPRPPRAELEARGTQSTGRSWRLLALCGAALAALAASFAGIYLLRPRPSRPLNFQPRDSVLIASFDNRTGDSLFDGAIEAALGRELTNSQFVSVAPRARINDTLALMGKPSSTRIDAELGREICLRDGGIHALISGRVEEFGSNYVIGADLMDPASGRSVAGLEEHAVSQADILPAVARLSNRLCMTLGESLSQIEKSDIELRKVATPSLRALELYSRADVEVIDGNYSVAFELLKQAIAEDPNFASAHILAAWSLHNLGKPRANYLPFAKQALALSSNASEPERYFIEGSYDELSGQPDRAIPAYQALLRIAPEHFWGLNRLVGLNGYGDRERGQMDLSIVWAKTRPNNPFYNVLAAYHLSIGAEDAEGARPFVERANKLLAEGARDPDPSGVAWLRLYPAYQAWMKDDVALVQTELSRAAPSLDAQDEAIQRRAVGFSYLALGESQRAKAWFQKASIADPLGYQSDMAVLQTAGANRAALRELLRRIEPRCSWGDTASALMIREGMLSQVDSALKEHQNSKDLERFPQFRVLTGELRVAQGKTDEGISFLKQGLQQTQSGPVATYFLGAESLAGAYEKRGDTTAALHVLENASANRARIDDLYLPMSGAYFWMRNQMALAGLYRRVGRIGDARKIEAQLRRLLAYADLDFPMLVELKKRQAAAAIAPSRH